jgi:putative hydrolase of the HAD superfamily
VTHASNLSGPRSGRGEPAGESTRRPGAGARALLLDVGAVITRTLFESHRDTEQVLGLPAGTLTWLGPIDPSTDALWRRMLAGGITERNYWEQRALEVGTLLGERWQPVDLFRRARHPEPDRSVRPEAVAAVAAARAAGARVGVLSNELELFLGKAFAEGATLLRAMDAIVDGTRTRVLKPDLRAYALATEALGVPAADTVFVDDQPRNVEGARAAGLRAVWFDVRDARGSFEAALRALDALPAAGPAREPTHRGTP